MINRTTTPNAAKLSECLWRNCFGLRLRFMKLQYLGHGDTTAFYQELYGRR